MIAIVITGWVALTITVLFRVRLALPVPDELRSECGATEQDTGRASGTRRRLSPAYDESQVILKSTFTSRLVTRYAFRSPKTRRNG
jgi:hypothetical protein